MAKESKAQKETVARVMHEFKHGELESGGRGKVRNPKQAIAIALSEAGASNQASPEENRRKLRDTKAKERRNSDAGPTRAELYRQAQEAGIPGRSRMDAAGLKRALERHGG